MAHEQHTGGFVSPQQVSRRAILARGAGGALTLGALSLLGACASGAKKTSSLPEPLWPDTPRPQPRAVTSRPTTRPSPIEPAIPAGPTGVIPRSAWADGAPVPALMDRMLPVNKITLHHDGMNAFTSVSQADAAERLENIRRGHRGHNWGDIGYHYVIDPAGRVWEGRPLMYQGAHVRDQNEGNLGVCVLGNFERQAPNQAQLNTVEHFVAALMTRYRVGVRNVYTHRELAATACPGRNLQPRLVSMRTRGGGLA